MGRCAPFIYDVWKSPETLAIISKIAGVDLVPAIDLEIGHINISVQSEEEKNKELAAVEEKKATDANWKDDDPIVDWHTDSYPFVCVTMLSDCSTMVGGETALRKADGEVVKVRGPQMVSPEFGAQKHAPLVMKAYSCSRGRPLSSKAGTSSIGRSVLWERPSASAWLPPSGPAPQLSRMTRS